MSYGLGAALQAGIYGHLLADTILTGLVGSAIYDAAPSGRPEGLYVTLGPEDVKDRSHCGGVCAYHDFTVSVITDEAGFQAAKMAAGAISDALVDADLVMTRGRLVGLRFLRARARRVANGTQRQIDLRFQAHVEDN